MNWLFTGFGAFGDVTYNPSWDAAQAAAEAVDATAELLAVTFEEAANIADRASETYDLVVHFGVAAARPDVCLERFAHNWQRDLHEIAPTRIVTAGPAARECAIPLDALAADLTGSAGLTWRVSHDAGTYVCNATLYHALGAHGPSDAMFVHIPAVDAETAREIGGVLARRLLATEDD